MERKFYAVREGKIPGIYDTWPDCLDQVRGHKGAICTYSELNYDSMLGLTMHQSRPFNHSTKLKRSWTAKT
jgi:hypothetical protein